MALAIRTAKLALAATGGLKPCRGAPFGLRHGSGVKALGIDFVSLSEQVDTSTPTGKTVFTVLGAVAELERSLICERVRAGIRNAKAKGRKLGRPRVAVDAARIGALRAQGHSWNTICRETGVTKGTAQRAVNSLSKIPA